MDGASNVSARITSFIVSDGAAVQLPADGVTLFVGPNNAGKSQSLRDLSGLAGRPQDYVGRALTDITLDKSGSNEDFVAWLTTHVPAVRDPSGQERRNVGEYGNVPLPSVASAWAYPNLQHIAPLFMYHADAMSRLAAGASVTNINLTREPITHPLQRAYLSADLEKALLQASREAFGVEVGVDRYAGNVICLRVGSMPPFDHDNGVPAPQYLEGLRALPLLEEQGDGMRSYMGLLLHILGGAHQITLVDEPEAFLHPPQARLLGQTLAQRTVASQQLFMATHSVDIVQGVLESDASVTIARITRNGSVNHVAVLEPDQVKQLWSDPLLRYSNLLDGLFHDAVVLCEGDADCRYYSSVLDSVLANKELPMQSRPPQLLFSHCGGKARLSSVIASLRAISIPIVVVADFDMLNDFDLLANTVRSLGGDPEEVRSDWNVVNSALESDVKPVSKVAMQEAITKVLGELPGDTVGKKEANRLKGLVKVDSGWDKVKRSGVSAVPGGDAHTRCATLLRRLEGLGLLIVPVGELERFVPSVPGHGPSWVTEVHREKLHEDTSNQPPRTFVQRIIQAATPSA